MKKKKPHRPVRVGILGGMFDPIHLGHLKLARSARISLKLDQVILVPAYISPFKKKQKSASAKDRLAMARLATKKFPWIKVSAVELKRKGISYSIDTIRYFDRKWRGKAHLFVLMGQDAFSSLRQWKDYREILKLAEIAVARRPGSRKRLPLIPYKPILMDETPISSTEVRKNLLSRDTKEGERRLPPQVLRYILENELYGF